MMYYYQFNTRPGMLSNYYTLLTVHDLINTTKNHLDSSSSSCIQRADLKQPEHQSLHMVPWESAFSEGKKEEILGFSYIHSG